MTCSMINYKISEYLRYKRNIQIESLDIYTYSYR